ncbi:MAG: signal transduction histidine kinase [Comamonadaceae bacterium]|nr:MAG: signal transduction histidine kinase [Comamonadaceae bacterium]
MTSPDPTSSAPIVLHAGVQEVAPKSDPFMTACPEDLSPSAMRKLIDQLRLRQCELERQNDALRRIQPKDTGADITAYQQALEDLRIAAAAFEIAQAIVVMNSHFQVLRVNKAFTEITGYQEQAISGHTTALLHSKKEPASTYQNIWRDTARKGMRCWECWLQHQNGEDIFAQGTATAVKNKEGDITHFVVAFHDHTLTHQQEQQRVLHEAAHREALVREVHHRIKNNLQGIRGLLQQFARERPEIAEQIHVVAGHLNGISIIHGLQGGQDHSLVRLCELTSAIAAATSNLWQTGIRVDIPTGWVFRVVAEKEAVSMALVIHELIVNAVKHGGKAHGHVSVSLQQGHSIEGVEVSILNAGFLRNNKDRPTESHHGLQLVESLRPRNGLTVTLAQRGNQVHTLLQVSSPVISLDSQ